MSLEEPLVANASANASVSAAFNPVEEHPAFSLCPLEGCPLLSHCCVKVAC